jgi:hypothetical protein
MRGGPDGVFEYDFLPGASHRPHFVTKPVALWLEDKLDFPAWTAAEIEAMPVTHISEWAVREKVEMDPLYATEHREGGTRALGTGVPGLTRDQLSVFSSEEWERQKPRLVYEHWMAEAKRRVQR